MRRCCLVLACLVWPAAACRTTAPPRSQLEEAPAPPEVVLQMGHSESVTAVAYSPNGQMLASASADRTVKLWDATSSLELRTLRNHQATVTAVAFSSDCRWLASGSEDRTVRLWDVDLGQEARVLTRHDGPVLGVAFSPDGRLVASASDDRTVAVVAVTSGQRVCTLRGHTGPVTSVAFAPQGNVLASGSEDETVRLWDVAKGQEAAAFRGHSGAVLSVAFSRAGLWLASGSFDETVRIWEVPSGRLLRKLGMTAEDCRANPSCMPKPGHTDPVHSVAIAPDGWLASGGSDGKIIMWDVRSGDEEDTLYQDFSIVQSVAVSPDGSTVAAAGSRRRVTFWRLGAFQEAQHLGSRAFGVSSVAFSGDGRWLATTANWESSTIKLWDLTTGLVSAVLRPAEKGEVRRVAFDGAGRLLAAAGSRASLWNVRGRMERPLSSRSIPTDVTVSRDGRWVAAAHYDDTTDVWEVGGRRRLEALPRGQHAAVVAFNPRGSLLAMGDRSGLVHIWDRAAGAVRPRLAGHTKEVKALAFNARGDFLASASSDGTVRLWPLTLIGQARVIPAHGSGVTAVAFDRDGARLASAGYDQLVKVWDVATGRELAILRGHEQTVNTVAFTPDGRHLVSGSDDGSVRLWDAASGAHLATLLSLDGEADWLVVTPDGLFDGSPVAWRLVRWRFGRRTRDVAPIEAFFNQFFHPGLLNDLLAGRRPRAARDIRRIDRRQPSVALQLVNPALSADGSSGTRSVQVRIDVEESGAEAGGQPGSGARDLRLFRNGSLVRRWVGDNLEGAGHSTFYATVPIVAGENRFTAYAFNRDNVKSADATLAVSGARSLARRGTAYILAIGVNEYANPHYNLKYAVADATAFAEELEGQQAALTQYARVVVVSLHDREATRANIIRALTALGTGVPQQAPQPGVPGALSRLKPSEPEDAVFVYYAGHGTAAGPRFYLIPYDLGYDGARTQLTEAAVKTILAHGVSDLDLEQALEQVDAALIVFVIDACNSGQALEADEKRRGPMNSKGLAQLSYEKGVFVLTAAQSYQAAVEAAELGHGYLTYALVEDGLRRRAADRQPPDGSVLVREWLEYAAERVPQMQDARMKEGRALLHEIAFVEGDERIPDLERRSLQRPRAFYRREPEGQPFLIARWPRRAPVNRPTEFVKQ
jgi:WD40 repeat protein/uncharacterized caspase-like protein